MEYRDLISITEFPSSLAKELANAAADPRALVLSWTASFRTADRLDREFFERLAAMLDPEHGAQAPHLFVAGNAGFGKSHLLAVVAAILRTPDLAESLAPGNLARAASRVAGQFHVVQLEAPGPSLDFLPGLLANLQSVAPNAASGSWLKWRQSPEKLEARLRELTAAIRGAAPAKPLLFVIDGLARRVSRRDPADLARDAADLGLLARIGQEQGFHLLCDARSGVLDGPESEIPEPLREALAQSFVTFALEGDDLFEVVARHLLPKTPEQRERIARRLERFTDRDQRLAREIETYIDLYPIHPDYLRLIGRLSLIAERCVWDVLRGAVQRALKTPLPDDHAGFITFDDFWNEITGDSRLKHRLEVEGVVSAGRRLERQARKRLDPELLPLAQRLVRALAVHRLTTTSIYSTLGITADELHAALGPWQMPSTALAQRPPSDRDEFARTPPDSAVEESVVSVNESTETTVPTPQEWVVRVLEKLREVDKDGFLHRDEETGRFGFQFERFRRFVQPEIVLHWVNAVPFLLLMVTGGLMLVARFAPVEQYWFAFAVLAHKTFAVSWLVSVPLVILARPRAHWQHMRVLLRWGPVDLLWMVQSVRSLYFRGAVVPPAPRFNTGQKTNAGLVPFYFFFFGITGAMMHFSGASLLPWYVHTALYFSTLASVGGHMHLALVNPGTRISLPAIFNGWSPMKYVEHHHPLSLPPSRRTHLPPPTARTLREALIPKRVEIAILVAMVIMASVGAAAFNRIQVATVKKQFASGFASAINPTRLSLKHQFGPAADNCTRCHTFTGGIPDFHCANCHQVVQERRTNHVGYHGKMQGHCTQCHKEHPAPNRTLMPPLPTTFTHDQTTFPLAGAHVQLECKQCHDKPRPPEAGIHFIGLNHKSCTDCHQEPHRGQFTGDCTTCHSPNGWTGRHLEFSHQEDSKFQLVGRHLSVECSKCHRPAEAGAALSSAQFKGLATDCASCHKDPHREPLGKQCTACHTPDGWKLDQLTFNHNRDTKFALADRHSKVACDQCHKSDAPKQALATASFRGTKTDCADCHRDPHRGQFERNCTQCHSTRGWEKSQLTFDHNRDSKFKLIKTHAQTDCLKCHVPPLPDTKLAAATFRGLKSECTDCHRDPHGGQFQRDCTRCHKEPTHWTGTDLHFSHNRDSKFQLTGRHATVECRKCHVPAAGQTLLASAKFKGLPQTCGECHEPHHPESYGPACLSCHDTQTPWPPARPGPQHFQRLAFDRERLSGKHLKIECQSCHEVQRVSGPLAFPSGKGECVSCHRADEPHQGTLGFECGRCHGNQAWVGDDLRFNHNTMARFELDHNHATVACAKCHEKGHWKPLKSSCRDCHPQIF
ncbi:MAG: hypothetical protein IT581_22660 [Verrucomicrobiales bacterium]|nr:hypothetical protein [Verrucomicrobiales bacterium]